MKLVVMRIELHKRTENLVERLRGKQNRVISLNKKRQWIRVVVTDDLFREVEFLVDKAGPRVNAQVFFLDTSSIDRDSLIRLRRGESRESVISDAVKKVRSVGFSAYEPMSEVASPGDRFQKWNDLKYVVYHVHSIDEDELYDETDGSDEEEEVSA